MKRNFSKVVVLLLVLVLAIVPVFALAAFAEGETVTLDVPLGVDTPTMNADGTLPEANAPAGYTFVGWTETVQNAEKVTEAPVYYEAGTMYEGEATVLYALYSKTEEGGSASVSYVKYSGTITEGNYLIVYQNSAMNTTVNSKRLMFDNVTISSNNITSTINDKTIWKIEKNGDYWTLYNEAAKVYAAGTGTKNNAGTLTSVTDYAKWTVTGSSTYEFVNLGNANKGVNKNLRKNGTYGFACYATSTGGALSLYKETVIGGGEATTYYSTMTSYTANFVGPDGAVNALRAADNKITVPGAPTFEGVFDAQEYKFAGWSATKLAVDGTTKPDMLTATSLELTEDLTYYAVYTYSVERGNGESTGVTGYKLVTDVAELTAGSQILIVDKSGTYAIGTTQNTNNRAAVSVTVNDGVITDIASNVQVITLENGASAGTFAFNVGNAYLYAASSGSNHLKTQTTKDANGSWAISIAADGVASIVAQGSYTRNVMRYNPNNGSPLFSCYASTSTTGSTVSIYKYSEGSSVTFYASILKDAASDKTEFNSASVTIGSNLSMNYFVSLKIGEIIDDYSMKFTFNGEETVVETATPVGDKYMFTFSGITPEKMGDNIKAELMKGDEVIDSYDEYSVKENLITVRDEVPETTEDQKKLINATLVYGAAAQQYKDYNTDNLVAEIPDNLTGPDGKNVRDKTESTVEGLKFTAAGVNFDYCNRIYIKYQNTTGTDAEVKVFISGKQCATKVVENNGVITVYSDALKATELGVTVRFEIWQNGAEVQELKYSAYDYVFGMKDTEDTALKNLIFALYQYGEAAKACNK